MRMKFEITVSVAVPVIDKLANNKLCCYICTQPYSNFMEHMNHYHKDTSFLCGACGCFFKTNNSLNAHVRRNCRFIVNSKSSSKQCSSSHSQNESFSLNAERDFNFDADMDDHVDGGESESFQDQEALSAFHENVVSGRNNDIGFVVIKNEDLYASTECDLANKKQFIKQNNADKKRCDLQTDQENFSGKKVIVRLDKIEPSDTNSMIVPLISDCNNEVLADTECGTYPDEKYSAKFSNSIALNETISGQHEKSEISASKRSLYSFHDTGRNTASNDNIRINNKANIEKTNISNMKNVVDTNIRNTTDIGDTNISNRANISYTKFSNKCTTCIHDTNIKDTADIMQTTSATAVKQDKLSVDTIAIHEDKGLIYQCDKCNFFTKYKTNLIRHKHCHSAYREQCEKCPAQFPTKYALKQHVLFKHNANVLYCDQCSKTFKSQSGLCLHRKAVHEHKINFKCQICLKGFYSKTHYEGHVNKHMKNRAFSCSNEGCKKKYFFKSHLTEHRAHCKGPVVPKCKKPEKVTCSECNAVFSTARGLKDHKNVVHGNVLQVCGCGKQFRWRPSLHRHRKNCRFAFLS